MNLHQDITPAVRDWLREPDGLPAPRIAEMAPLVHRTPQQRRTFAPLAGRFHSMFAAAKIVAAGALVALVGGFLLTVSLSLRPADVQEPAAVTSGSVEPTRITPPTPSAAATDDGRPVDPNADASLYHVIPDVVPEGAESGTIETPYGPARWMRIVGDDALFPADIMALVPGPTGYLAFRGILCDEEEADPSCVGLFAADEVYGPWEQIPLPAVARAQLNPDGAGTYWLLTDGMDSLWRSSDARDWREVDTSAIDTLVSPGSDLFTWSATSHPLPVTTNGTTIAPVFHVATDTLKVLGVRKAFKDADEIIPTGKRAFYEVRDGWHSSLGKIQAKQTPRGLRITKRGDGAVLAVLKGVDLATFERWMIMGGPLATQVAVIEDDRVVDVVDVPWSEQAYGRPSIVVTPDAFRAYVPNQDGTFDLWRSPDGREWALETVVDLLPDRPGWKDECLGWDGLFYANPSWRSGPAYTAFLCPRWDYFDSDDGVTWRLRPKQPKGGDNVNSFASGWTSNEGDSGQWWFRVDGDWERTQEVERVMGVPEECEQGDPSDGSWDIGDAIIQIRSVADRYRCPRVIRVIELESAGAVDD